MNTYTIEQSRFVHFLTASKKSAPFWLLVRLYPGYWGLDRYARPYVRKWCSPKFR